MHNYFNILVAALGRISDYSGLKLLSDDITIFTVHILNTFSVINLKPCLNEDFNVDIYLDGVHLTSSAPLALQGELHH